MKTTIFNVYGHLITVEQAQLLRDELDRFIAGNDPTRDEWFQAQIDQVRTEIQEHQRQIEAKRSLEDGLWEKREEASRRRRQPGRADSSPATADLLKAAKDELERLKAEVSKHVDAIDETIEYAVTALDPVSVYSVRDAIIDHLDEIDRLLGRFEPEGKK